MKWTSIPIRETGPVLPTLLPLHGSWLLRVSGPSLLTAQPSRSDIGDVVTRFLPSTLAKARSWSSRSLHDPQFCVSQPNDAGSDLRVTAAQQPCGADRSAPRAADIVAVAILTAGFFAPPTSYLASIGNVIPLRGSQEVYARLAAPTPFAPRRPPRRHHFLALNLAPGSTSSQTQYPIPPPVTCSPSTF